MGPDTDGDGLWDAWENNTYQYDKSFLLSGRSGVSAEFSTDWQDPDTDGDNITDRQEYSVERVAATDVSEESELGTRATDPCSMSNSSPPESAFLFALAPPGRVWRLRRGT